MINVSKMLTYKILMELFMNSITYLKKIFYLSVLAFFNIALAATLTLKNTQAKVYFSPNGGCQEAINYTINTAQNVILVQAYTFTSAPIAHALKQAHKRGVKVLIILDRSQMTGRYSGITYLQNAGIPIWIDSKHAIAHNKVMIIDNEIVITGSFNFTKAAEKSNAENLLIIKNDELAKLYIDNWQEHKIHCEQVLHN